MKNKNTSEQLATLKELLENTKYDELRLYIRNQNWLEPDHLSPINLLMNDTSVSTIYKYVFYFAHFIGRTIANSHFGYKQDQGLPIPKDYINFENFMSSLVLVRPGARFCSR